jgi:hypothetical protein
MASMSVFAVRSVLGEGIAVRREWGQGIKGAPKKLWGLVGG